MFDNTQYELMKRVSGDKIVTPTTSERIRDAAIFSVGAAGLGMLARKGFHSLVKSNPSAFKKGIGSLLKKRVGTTFAPMSISKDLAVGTVLGLTNRDLRNAVIRKKMGLGDEDFKSELKKRRQNTIKIVTPYLKKTAGIGGSVVKGVSTIGKGIGYGLMPISKTAPVSHRVFGLGVKAGAGYGLYRGGKALYNKLSDDPGSGQYTTFLRNNLLAGHIQPSELNTDDMESVRSLGMK